MEKDGKITTIKQQIYKIIKDDICNGVYKPGQQINEVELANRLSISRSPIRESLRQLVSDGLAIEKPNRGVFVKKFSFEEMNDIYEYRVIIESFAIEQCTKKLNDKLKNVLMGFSERLERLYEERNLTDYINEDTIFHQTLVDLCGNEIVIDAYERVRLMNSQFRIYSLMDDLRFKESVEEHQGVIKAILDGDYQKAVEYNKIHLNKAKDTIIKTLQNK